MDDEGMERGIKKANGKGDVEREREMRETKQARKAATYLPVTSNRQENGQPLFQLQVSQLEATT